MIDIPDLPSTRRFDLAEGEEAKEEGMELAADNRAGVLAVARHLAVVIARRQGRVSADDVQFAMIDRRYDPAMLGNAAGSIFRGKQWRQIGREKSQRVSNHARWVFVWELVEETGVEEEFSFRSGELAEFSEGAEDVVGGERRLHSTLGRELDRRSTGIPTE